jgi:hypothetical protein
MSTSNRSCREHSHRPGLLPLASYVIPILLRVTVAKDTFRPSEFSLGLWSVPCGWVAVGWGVLMTLVLCLPEVAPITAANVNYSPLVLIAVLLYSVGMWHLSAKFWFKNAIRIDPRVREGRISRKIASL